MKDNEGYSLYQRGLSTLSLARKVGGELRDWRQFLDADRRRDLFQKGRQNLIGITAEAETDLKRIELEISEDMISLQETDSTVIAYSSPVGLATVIFPSGCEISYTPSNLLGNEENDKSSKWQVSSTTRINVVHGLGVDSRIDHSKEGLWPSEGYITSEGLVSRMVERKRKDWVQHGGFIVSGNIGQLYILDYETMIKEAKKPLSPGECIIQANWYMDSANQYQVFSRRNLQEPRPYNALGMLFDDYGNYQYFALTSSMAFMLGIKIKEADPTQVSKNSDRYQLPNMREVAGMCNVVARSTGMTHWKIGGLEFNGGGVGKDRMYRYTDHFDVTY